MPVYAYTCTSCGHRFDIRQSFTDDTLTVCPVCNGRLRKDVSGVGITFKGPGFYRTDSAKGSGNGHGAAGSEGTDGPARKADKHPGDSASGSAAPAPTPATAAPAPSGGDSGGNASGSGSSAAASASASTSPAAP